MRFRRIYWVTEQFDSEGRSHVTGVFTSVHDLVENGVGVRDISDKQSGYRVSLVELDSKNMPLCVFCSPDFGDVEAALQPYVESGEMTAEEVARIREALK
jgi:hypothetical protein